MMGLNDDIDDGLDPEYKDDGTTPPDLNTKQPDAPAITLVAGTVVGDIPPNNTNISKTTDEDIFGAGIVKNELPNLDAEFIIANEAENTIFNLNDIKKSLVKSNSICREDINGITEVFPAFNCDDRKLIHYTSTKSKTLFKPTLEALDEAMDAQYSSIKASTSKINLSVYTSITNFIKVVDRDFNEVIQRANDTLLKSLEANGTLGSLVFSDQTTTHDLFYSDEYLKRNDCVAHPDADVEKEFQYIRGAFNNYVRNKNFLIYLNDSAAFEDVVFFFNMKVMVFKDNKLSIADPVLKDKVDSASYSNRVTLEAIIRRFTGEVGTKIIRNFKTVLSSFAEELSTVEAQIKAVDDTDFDFKLKTEAVIKIASKARENLIFALAIVDFLQYMIVLIDATSNIINISSRKTTMPT